METLIFRPSILNPELSKACEGKIKILTSATSVIWCLVWSGACGVISQQITERSVLMMKMNFSVSGHI